MTQQLFNLYVCSMHFVRCLAKYREKYSRILTLMQKRAKSVSPSDYTNTFARWRLPMCFRIIFAHKRISARELCNELRHVTTSIRFGGFTIPSSSTSGVYNTHRRSRLNSTRNALLLLLLSERRKAVLYTFIGLSLNELLLIECT